MNAATRFIAVYGATGHTGRFVVDEVHRRGLPVLAIGRSAARLDEAVPASVPRRVAAIDDPGGLERAFAGSAVVIHCAGPFMDTAAPVARAALRAGAHYLDVTAEQASAQASLADLDASARQADRVVIPAAGFYGGLADLLASALASAHEIDEFIDEITVAVALDRWWPTEGTRKTAERNTAQRMVVTQGRLTPLAAPGPAADWAFSSPLGRQPMVEMPFSEVITLAHHLRAGTIRSLLNRSALQDVRDPATPPPTAVDHLGRSAQRFEMQVRLAQDGITRTAGACGQDIYAVTAPIVIEAALRLMAPAYARRGALSLAQAVDPIELLGALHGRSLDVFGDVKTGSDVAAAT